MIHDEATPRSTTGERVATAASLDEVARVAHDIQAAMERVIEGKPDAIRLVLTALLAEGHVLIEDVPGVGKTMLARALGRAVAADVHRVQFTPDLLPSDLTGVSVFNPHTREFEFKPGALFAQIVLGDEINRASPKTQSALLEAMAERRISADGVTRELAAPFMVLATQNPIEMEGTYPLPEAQRDRFMLQLRLGYPDPAAEVAMLEAHGGAEPVESLQPVTNAATVARLATAVRDVHVSAALREWIVALVGATRTTPLLRLGASPRASLHLLRAARAAAAIDGRDFVIPDDVQALVTPVLAHRVLRSVEAEVQGRSSHDIVAQVTGAVAIPGER